MKTYRKKLASSFEDIWNNGFSILDTKKVQKFITVNQIFSYYVRTNFARHAQTPHIEPKESRAVYIKNSNNLVPRTFPIPLHALGSWLTFKLFRNHS